MCWSILFLYFVFALLPAYYKLAHIRTYHTILFIFHRNHNLLPQAPKPAKKNYTEFSLSSDISLPKTFSLSLSPPHLFPPKGHHNPYLLSSARKTKYVNLDVNKE